MQRLEAPNISTTVVIRGFSTKFAQWIVILELEGSTFALPTATMFESSAPARRPDSSLKSAEEMEWIHDPDDDATILPPPPATNSTLNSFICHSGRAVKPTEKIQETASTIPAKWSAVGGRCSTPTTSLIDIIIAILPHRLLQSRLLLSHLCLLAKAPMAIVGCAAPSNHMSSTTQPHEGLVKSLRTT
ncbi:hypothetical protein BDR06DRAFT_948595 [Suillus hirtellus]|nr:hypothetical protein BDR06DRAFT_948595 [Suillus hirtellus]